MTIIPKEPLILTGADLSGTNGDTNRTYTLANDSIRKGLFIIVSNAFLQIDIDFTFNENTFLITFLNPIWDNQNITINYYTETTEPEPESTDYYTNTLTVSRFSGIGVEVSAEFLGLGDGTTSKYDTEFNNIISDSYNIYYTETDSNNANNLIEDTHYTINKDRGSIELTSLGRDLTNTNNIYIDYVYSPRQSDTTLQSYIYSAGYEVDKLTGNYWGTEVTRTKYIDGFYTDYPSGDEPYSNLANTIMPEIELNYQGVNSIDSIEILDKNGNVSSTLETTQYRLIDSRIILNQSIPNGQANIKITYKQGYTEVPTLIKELTALIAGKMALVNISGGSYKDISTYSIGRKSFSIGMIYVNVESSIKQMELRINTILELLGYNYHCS